MSPAGICNVIPFSSNNVFTCRQPIFCYSKKYQAMVKKGEKLQSIMETLQVN